MRGMPMKTLDDLTAFINLVLAPEFDIVAAQQRLGAIDHWMGGRARVECADPALKQAVIETSEGAVCGIQTILTSPLEVSWSDLTRALGEPEREALTVDDWGGPIPYQFCQTISG